MNTPSLRDLADLPPTLSVEEGGRLIGLGRSASYRSAAEYESTNGARGLPVIRLNGSRMVVPTAHLLRLLGLEPSTNGDDR